MALRLQANNASTTLAGAIGAGATSLSVVSGTGALFPLPGFGPTGQTQAFNFVLIKAGNTSIYEYCRCSSRSTDTFASVTRGLQGTTALSWSAGDTVAFVPTADDYANCVQTDDLQAQLGNYAADTGTANAYVVTVTPAVTTLSTGFPLRFKAAHANTGASTLNGHPLVLQDGNALSSGIITANGVYTVLWDGSRWQLEFPDLGSYLTGAAAVATFAPIDSPNFTTSAELNGVALVTATQLANAVAGAVSGPQNGTIIQGGVVSVTGIQTYYFTPAFPNACLSIVASPVQTQATYWVSNPANSKSSFQIQTPNTNLLFSWLAIGY
jgi:hypothetical protein